ncbi:MAG TPA: hypothetical protein DDZ81_23135 [Acetobacteraceae bacterium]|nr:hypothetical protein [Acetobacteraceae bacterium]
MNGFGCAGELSSLDNGFTACLDRARSMIPLLRSAPDRIDAKNELTPHILNAMFDAGLFELLLPKTYGGAELKPAEFIQCVEAIAQGDAAGAGCMNQGSRCSMAAAYASPRCGVGGVGWQARRAGLGPRARRHGNPNKGGWRVTGTWTFSSGSRHAT